MRQIIISCIYNCTYIHTHTATHSAKPMSKFHFSKVYGNDRHLSGFACTRRVWSGNFFLVPFCFYLVGRPASACHVHTLSIDTIYGIVALLIELLTQESVYACGAQLERYFFAIHRCIRNFWVCFLNSDVHGLDNCSEGIYLLRLDPVSARMDCSRIHSVLKWTSR